MTSHSPRLHCCPFSVVPAAGALGAGDTVQVTVAFHALTHGDYFGSLCCNTDEQSIHTKLHGEAVDIDVVLSTNSVQADKTFITMSNETSVFIENKRNIPAHFQWKAFPSEGEENKEKRRRQCRLLHPLSEVRLENFMQEKELEKEKGIWEDHTALLSSRVQEKMAKVQKDPLLFSNDIFFIEPMVKLINQGALDAAFTYIPSATHVALGFKLEPKEGIIAPGGTQTVQISFHTTMLGSFEEKFQFRVAESPIPVILTIKGSITGPNLHFDLPELDFGDISFGFPYTQRCRLTNCSVVPVMFKLRMSDDGTQPAVDSLDQIRREGDPSWRKGIHFYVEPKEFTINPSQGIILPQGQQDIEVTLCSNTVMEFHRRLLVDVEGFGEGVATLTITARHELHPPKFKPQPPKGKKTSLESPASRWRRFKMRQEEAAGMLKEVDDFTQSLRDKVGHGLHLARRLDSASAVAAQGEHISKVPSAPQCLWIHKHTRAPKR